MTWEKAKSDRPCGRCQFVVTAGTALLLVSSANLPRCVRCAKDTYDAEPPMTWPITDASERLTQPFETSRRLASKLRHGFDARQARTGEPQDEVA